MSLTEMLYPAPLICAFHMEDNRPRSISYSKEDESSSTEHTKLFEVLLAKHYRDSDRWSKIALELPGWTPEAVAERYAKLEAEIADIEEGKIQVPAYHINKAHNSKKQKDPRADRRKGVPWTEEEHRLFLIGLAKFGKGDWRSIAKTLVTTRTPTQVASHAQKYFIRLNSLNKKDKRRASIHDITSAPSTSEDGKVESGNDDAVDNGAKEVASAQANVANGQVAEQQKSAMTARLKSKMLPPPPHLATHLPASFMV